MRAQRNVWIAVPAYTGQEHLATQRSIITDMLQLAQRGDKVTIFDECGNAMVGDARALMVANFLAGDGTDLVFVDSDVSWEAGGLVKLVDYPVDFVAGCYPQRKDPLDFCMSWLTDRKELWAVDPVTGLRSDKGLLEVEGVPAGFMRLSRAMLERMVAHYPDLTFYCDVAPGKSAVALFESYWIRDVTLAGKKINLKMGEDYSFCKRWRDMGGQIWIDPNIRMGHTGYKTFVGSIGDWLKSRLLPAAKTDPAPMMASVNALTAKTEE